MKNRAGGTIGRGVPNDNNQSTIKSLNRAFCSGVAERGFPPHWGGRNG